MNQTNKNNKVNPEEDNQEAHFFQNANIPFEKSKDEIWLNLSDKIKKPASAKTIGWSTEKIVFSLAASFMILLAIGSVFRFYSKTIRVETGEQITYVLPDNSKVTLNAQSALRYHPLWWNISRSVSFEGEAFFEVEKGSTFIVGSKRGNTEVLGTSFNIYSRPDAYSVTCITGKVRVMNKLNDDVTLTPEYQASVALDGTIVVQKNENPTQTISWQDGMFHFNTTPLKFVIYEIERQYNVQISMPEVSDLVYTGFFSKNYEIEDILNLVCKPFNLKYTKEKDKHYKITF